jgi:hypothetical protein
MSHGHLLQAVLEDATDGHSPEAPIAINLARADVECIIEMILACRNKSCHAVCYALDMGTMRSRFSSALYLGCKQLIGALQRVMMLTPNQRCKGGEPIEMLDWCGFTRDKEGRRRQGSRVGLSSHCISQPRQ